MIYSTVKKDYVIVIPVWSSKSYDCKELIIAFDYKLLTVMHLVIHFLKLKMSFDFRPGKLLKLVDQEEYL